MSQNQPRASSYYSCEYLTDVLYLEDVRPVGKQTMTASGTTIGISIDSDTLIDNIITSLQAVQRERQIQAAQSRVKQFTRDLEIAVDANRTALNLLGDSEVRLRDLDLKLTKAKQDLDALKGATQ